ncbi:MAG TPA: hypothetical protein VHX12_10570, partial [Acidisoma sp.]|nr:hypothetical protein [Acidisoma sp.]
RDHPGNMVLDGFGAALCGQLAAALLSAPTIGSLAFYLQLGCVTGTAARMLEESRGRQLLASTRRSTANLVESRAKKDSFA